MRKPQVLVVEDEAVVALHIQGALADLGYGIAGVVDSGEEAVRRAANRPDVVLMDVMLAGSLDGVEAAKQIRQRFRVPVIFLTAYADMATLQRIKVAEPFGYILKPLRTKELQAAIEIALARSTTERERGWVESLRQQKLNLDATGQLASGVAHHLNNMLMVIMSNIEVAATKVPEDLKPHLSDALSAGDRAAAIVEALVTFSGRRALKRGEVDVSALLGKVVAECRATREGIDFALECAADLPTVHGDADLLQQAVMNLCSNACDASSQPSPAGREAVVRIGATALPPTLEDPSGSPGSKPDGHVAIFVKDNGVGLADDIRKRIFEPFFTTKDIGEGSGLGLAFAYGVVRQHLGWIDVQSKPGAGSTFTLFLPVARPAVLSGEREITAQMLSDAEIALASQRRSVQPSDPTKNSEIGELRE